MLVGRRAGSSVGSTLVFNLRTQIDNITPRVRMLTFKLKLINSGFIRSVGDINIISLKRFELKVNLAKTILQVGDSLINLI